eukprot:g689.t1
MPPSAILRSLRPIARSREALLEVGTLDRARSLATRILTSAFRCFLEETGLSRKERKHLLPLTILPSRGQADSFAKQIHANGGFWKYQPGFSAATLAEISKKASDWSSGLDEDYDAHGNDDNDDHSAPPTLQRFPEPGSRRKDFDVRQKLKACENIPWESMRKDKVPLYQDLTHAERVQVQADYKRKLMLDRKVMWLKMNQVPDPKRAAKMEMRVFLKEREEHEREKRAEEWRERNADSGQEDVASTSENDGEATRPFGEHDTGDAYTIGNRKKKRSGRDGEESTEVFPQSVLSVHAEEMRAKNVQKREDQMRRDELESRKRMKIRQYKLQNSKLLRQKTPPLGQTPTDPLIEAKCPKGVHDVVYQISQLPPNRKKEWVMERLDVLAPKLRSQLAVKLQLGYTPPLKFRHAAFAVSSNNRGRLLKIAKELRERRGEENLGSWTQEMNWTKGY